MRIDLDWKFNGDGLRVRWIYADDGTELGFIEVDGQGYRAHLDGMVTPLTRRMWEAIDHFKKRRAA